MGGIEILVLLALLLNAGKGRAPGAPTPSAATPGPAIKPDRAPPVATAPPPGGASTPSQARAQQASAKVPVPFPQAVPAGLPPFPGPGWKPFVPTPPAVVARANQLLPELWRTGAGTRKTEQTAGTWTTYLATAMGNNIRGVTAHKLVALPGALPNA